MKRYQCIKNYYVGPDRVFTAGKIYPEYEIVTVGAMDKPWFYITDNHGDSHTLTPKLREHFQELLDLNVDDVDSVYADQEHLEYVYMQQAPGCTRKGLAIIAIFILTVLALIFFR